MSHKKRPSKASAAPPLVKKAVLPDQAEAALGASRYREAIEHYKELLGAHVYEVEVGDCLYGVYQMIGKLNPTLYALR